MRTRRHTLLTVLVALLGVAPLRAQAPASIDEMAREFKAQHVVPGLVVGLATGEGDRIFAYGVRALDSGAAMDGDTGFEIGSIAKVFTGLLLADMATRGEVALDDPLASHLPAGVIAPEHAGAQPTLQQLSMHTSALPRLPANLAPSDMSDPYADYTAESLHDFLSGYTLPRPPGSQYEYSNLGAGLLGQLLADRAGRAYGELLAMRVLEPLGLTRSYVPDPGSPDERMALGYADGGAAPFWHMGPLAGAGGVRASADDLLRFVRAQIDPRGTALEEAIVLTQERTAHVMEGLDMALGWHITSLGGERVYWHNGATGGFRGFAGFVPGRGIGVVVLANAAIPLAAVDRFAVEILTAALQASRLP